MWHANPVCHMRLWKSQKRGSPFLQFCQYSSICWRNHTISTAPHQGNTHFVASTTTIGLSTLSITVLGTRSLAFPSRNIGIFLLFLSLIVRFERCGLSATLVCFSLHFGLWGVSGVVFQPHWSTSSSAFWIVRCERCGLPTTLVHFCHCIRDL